MTTPPVLIDTYLWQPSLKISWTVAACDASVHNDIVMPASSQLVASMYGSDSDHLRQRSGRLRRDLLRGTRDLAHAKTVRGARTLVASQAVLRRTFLACALVAVGCGRAETFECDQDSDCAGVEAVGRCEPNGWCSFPDDTCPSDRRYGTQSGDGLAGTCVPEGDGTGDATGTGTADTSTASTVTEGSTDPPSTSGSSSSEDGGPSCGNGVRDDGEECDGPDFGGQTCADFGHAGGMLDCDGCTIDTDNCDDCGDGVVQGDEVCDTTVRDQTCADFGWFGGMLGCSPDCDEVDESGCSNCGNDFIDPGEECDGSIELLQCEALGFGPGVVGCSDICLYDTTGCGPLECGADAMLPLGQCPDECSSCDDNACLFDCTGGSVCSGDDIVCPPGWPCLLVCSGGSACADANIECPEYYGCAVECSGSSGCAGLDVECSLSGMCSVSCNSDPGVCADADVDCGGDECTAVCDGDEPGVECGPSCACSGCG